MSPLFQVICWCSNCQGPTEISKGKVPASGSAAPRLPGHIGQAGQANDLEEDCSRIDQQKTIQTQGALAFKTGFLCVLSGQVHPPTKVKAAHYAND